MPDFDKFTFDERELRELLEEVIKRYQVRHSLLSEPDTVFLNRAVDEVILQLSLRRDVGFFQKKR